jgi:hypothetical protein
MKRNRKHKGAIWDYLEHSGVLENGTDEEIKKAKKAYRKDYYLDYKRNQRANKPEFIVNFSSENGEYSRVKMAAERHKMTMTNFIRSSVLAYLQQRFLVPNAFQVAHLEETLSQCLNEIQKLVGAKEKYYWSREEKFEAIEKRIEKLEYDIDQVFRNPPLQQNDSQNKII